MGKIPKAKAPALIEKRIPIEGNVESDKKVVFSFKAIEKNEYFDLDCTCQNWANDLFETMKIVSNIYVGDIYSGKYSRDGSPLRIHQHENAKAPCDIPKNVSLEQMWQIRISKSKGGVHGVFNENVFYVIWFDPLHNLYPDDRYGGLKKIKPPSTCCKDRDAELKRLNQELIEEKNNSSFWENYAKELEDKTNY